MGVKDSTFTRKEGAHVTVTVPPAAGDYAEGRITFGLVASGERELSFQGVTALLESCPAGASLELWLPRVSAGDQAASTRTDADYYFAGVAVFPPRVAATPTGITASFGYANWLLSGWVGAQLRMRSGGVGGAAAFSGTAF